MAETFDPYRKWLGIPLEEQPPNHYRLLGIGAFESDADVIQEAADRQMAHVQRHKLGQFGPLSQKLLNELSTAKLCLLHEGRKAEYDKQLRAQLAVKNPPAAAPAAAQSAPAAPRPVVQPLSSSPASGPARPVAPQPAASQPAARDTTYDFVSAPTLASGTHRKAGRKAAAAKNQNLPLVVGSAVTAVCLIAAGAIWFGTRGNPPVAVAPHKPPKIEAPKQSPQQAATEHADPQPAVVPQESMPDEPADSPAAEPEPVPAEPAVATTDEPAAQNPSGKPIDLLPLIDLKQVVSGKWQLTGGRLQCVGGEQRQLLQIPCIPPADYQLDVVVTRNGDTEIDLGLVVGGRQVTAIIDGWGSTSSGLQMIDGKSGNENASTFNGPALRTGKPSKIVCTVRGDRVVIGCDGKKIIDWRGPPAGLSVWSEFAVPDKRVLSIGGTSAGFVVGRMRITPFAGEAQITPAAKAPPAVVARVENEPVAEPSNPPEQPPPAQPTPNPQPTVVVAQPKAPGGPAAPGEIRLEGHKAPIVALATSPDSLQVVTVTATRNGEQRPMLFWDLGEKKIAGDIRPWQWPYHAVTYTSDGQMALTGGPGGEMCTWQMGRQGPVSFFNRDDRNAVLAVAASADGGWAVGGGIAGLEVFERRNTNGPAYKWTSPDGEPVSAVAISADGSRLLAGVGGTWNVDQPIGGTNHKLHVWDGPTRRTSALEAHTGAIRAVAVSADGTRGVSASQDATIRVWDLKAGRTKRVLSGHDGPVLAVALSPDGKFVLSGGMDKTVRLWNAQTGAELKQFEGNSGIVRAVAFTYDGKYAVAGGNDCILRAWELGRTARLMPSAPPAAAARPPVPSEAELAETLRLVREVYDGEIKQAKKAAEKIALAEKLFRKAADSPTDAERYALLSEARSLATASAAPALVIQVIEQIGAKFEIDTLEEVATAVDAIGKENLSPVARKEMVEGLLPLGEQALAQDRFDLAKRLLVLANGSARKANDPALAKQVAARLSEANEAKKVFEAVKAAEEVLAKTPDDPAANLALGKYLCLTKGNWPEGAKHLAKSAEDSFRQIAQREQDPPTVAAKQVELADLWWALSEQAKGKDKLDYAARAEHWYSLALPELTGLSQTKVDRRMKDFAALQPGKSGGSSALGAGEKSGGVALQMSKPLALRIKQAIKKNSLSRTPLLGSAPGTPFVEVPQAGLLLVGFNYTLNNAGRFVTSMQPIYRGPKGQILGSVWGQANGQVSSVLAENGYAVGSLRGDGSYWIYGFEVTFCKVDADSLDSASKTSSAWIGYGQTGTGIRLGNNKLPIVGVFGQSADRGVASLGLMQLPAN